MFICSNRLNAGFHCILLAGDLYNEAAEAAMAAMKGRLANTFYMLAEECYTEMEWGSLAFLYIRQAECSHEMDYTSLSTYLITFEKSDYKV